MEVKVGVKMDITPTRFYLFTFLPFYLSKLLSSTKCLTSLFIILFYPLIVNTISDLAGTFTVSSPFFSLASLYSRGTTRSGCSKSL